MSLRVQQPCLELAQENGAGMQAKKEKRRNTNKVGVETD